MLDVAVVGLGAIGAHVTERLLSGVPGIRLAAVVERRPDRPDSVTARLGCAALAAPLEVAVARAALVVDCVSSASFVEVAEAAVTHRRDLLTVNSATLLDHMDIVERAAANGNKVTVATGALAGFDAVRAAAEGEIASVAITTRKHPRAFAGAPYVVEQGIDLSAVKEPLQLFRGSVREAARSFPDNVNVAASLSLAGIGPDRTQAAIWADPAVERNTHTIEVEADSTRFQIAIAGVPSPKNPRTGLLTPNSVLACLRAMGGPLRVGS
jgi:aspartate dehydrogenase